MYTLSDTNYKYITQQQYVIPELIIKDQQLIADYQVVKANWLELDNANTQPYNYYHSIIDYYHSELEQIQGIHYSQYLNSYLISSAQLAPNNPHYPVDPSVWVHFIPKQLPSNTGQPTSVVATSQNELIDNLVVSIDDFMAAYPESVRVTGPPTNTVPNPNPPPPTIDVPDSVFTDMANAVNTNAQTLLTRLQAYLPVLSTNPSTDPAEVTTTNTAITVTTNTINSINTYLAIPEYGRYSDANLNNLKTAALNQKSQNTQRVGEINGYLGTLTQDANTGSFAGSGYYYTFFVWIDLRINRTKGSLAQYYATDLIIKFLENTIAFELRQEANYNTMATTTKITEDVSSTDTSVTVGNIAGLSVGDPISMCDNTTSVVANSISGITGNIIALNNQVGINLLVSKQARLFKKLI